MALHPNTFVGQDRLQPGARGEIFQVDIPGYRDGADRINRTQNKLNTNAHDVPNIKYSFDDRLPVLFKYGYAFGYNQIVIPKGRIVAVDPHMDLVDFDMKKAHNTLTLANGGMPVKVRETSDTYIAHAADGLVSKSGAAMPGVGKEWMPVAGYVEAYPESKVCRPFKTNRAKAQLTNASYEVDTTGTGRVTKGGVKTTVRPGNYPIGIMQRNEYTRDDDAFNGIMPGAVLTDAMVEMPWFLFKDKAEGNPWGSAYGGLFPGALVKSDENGRFVVSPLSFEELVADMSIAEYEAERQQVIGQVYSVSKELVPEGAAKYAQWAISDILNFEGFNPSLYRQNNRRGEDAVSNSPYKSTGEYPGYPYDPAYMDSDLHMLASYRNTYDQRMQHEYRFDHGIPGLTDGYNAVSTPIEDRQVGLFGCPSTGKGESAEIDKAVPYADMYFRTRVENVEQGSLQIQVGEAAYAPCTLGAEIKVKSGMTEKTFLRVKYVDELQGIVVLEVFNRTEADAFFEAVGAENKVAVSLKYNKRGRAGVPTFMDWDGCIGSVKILLQK